MDVTFQNRVNELAHEVTQLCYHCHKCTAGCPVAYAMDYGPDRILRMVQLGQKAQVLASPDIWVCAGCETCGARCPNEIDIAHVMDALRQIAQAEQATPAIKRVPLFHTIFLRLIEWTGQMHEASLLGGYKLLSGDWFSDLEAGAQLFLKGKVPLVPKFSKNRAWVRRVFAQSAPLEERAVHTIHLPAWSLAAGLALVALVLLKPMVTVLRKCGGSE